MVLNEREPSLRCPSCQKGLAVQLLLGFPVQLCKPWYVSVVPAK